MTVGNPPQLRRHPEPASATWDKVRYRKFFAVSTTSRLEYLSNSINHDLGLIELDPVTAVWNNDDLAVRGKARHRLLLHRLGCGGIASRQNDQRHVTVSAARSNLGGTLRKAFHLAGQGLKKLLLHPDRL